jgi:transmembrane sensor
MDKDLLKQLLERYHAGTATPQEIEQLDSWYENLAPGDGKPDPGKPHLQKLLRLIHQQIKDNPPVRKINIAVRWYAAAAVAAMVVCFCWLYTTQRRGPAQWTNAQTIQVPAGNLYKVGLPDSSTVWLSGGSELQYANNFNEQNRLVRLMKGKAFFIVHKNSSHLFIVESGTMETRVLGTSFTIDLSVTRSVSVATGSVQVSYANKLSPVLKPGDLIKLDTQSGVFTFNTLPAELVNAWTLKEFTVSGLDFKGLAEAFDAFYGIRLQTSIPAIQKHKYNIILRRDMSVQMVLSVICRLYEDKYQLTKDGSYQLFQ